MFVGRLNEGNKMDYEERKKLAYHIEQYLKDVYNITLNCQAGGLLVAINDYFNNELSETMRKFKTNEKTNNKNLSKKNGRLKNENNN